MKSIYRALIVIAVIVSATACSKKGQPNIQYFPNMYVSPSYETNGDYAIFPGNQEAQAPADSTISRGWMPPKYPNTNGGKQAAAANMKDPLPYTKRNVENGKALFNIYCAICHGKKGDGKGPLATREKIMGIPGFNDPGRDIDEGDIYHTIYYGLNNMGSYASQTTRKERWQIVHYVMTLRHKLQGKSPREFVEDTTTNNEHFDREIDPVIGRQAMNTTEKK